MSRLMIIGCGGVASVAIHKCCQNSDVFTEIMIASRTVSKCDALFRFSGVVIWARFEKVNVPSSLVNA